MPEQPARKKFDLAHPGFKEYAIVFSVTIGAFLLYEWLKNRNQPQPADGQGGGPGTVLVGPAGGGAALWLALQDLAGKKTGGHDKDRDHKDDGDHKKKPDDHDRDERHRKRHPHDSGGDR